MLLLAGLMGIMAVGATAYIFAGKTQDGDPMPAEMGCDVHVNDDDQAVESCSTFDQKLNPSDVNTGILPRNKTHSSIEDAKVDDGSELARWLDQEHQAEVSEFSTDEDRLMVVYDDQQYAEPVLGIEPDEIYPCRLHLTLNGERVASVKDVDGFSIDHVNLVAQSALSGIIAA